MNAKTVADLPRETDVVLVDCRDLHLYRWEDRWFGTEFGGHQRQIVELSGEFERLARIPRAPDRTHRQNILAQAWSGRNPLGGEASLDMPLDLRAKTHHKPTAREVA